MAAAASGDDRGPVRLGAPAPRGVRLGVDVGAVRIGVAASDPQGVLAAPVTTLVDASGNDSVESTWSDDTLSALAEIIAECAPSVVYVGLPLSMDGSTGPAARRAWACARALAARIAPIRVRLVDERLTTVTAHRHLHDAGRREREHRAVVDQVAAVVILQAALDAERTSGREPGAQVGVKARPRRQGRKERG